LVTKHRWRKRRMRKKRGRKRRKPKRRKKRRKTKRGRASLPFSLLQVSLFDDHLYRRLSMLTAGNLLSSHPRDCCRQYHRRRPGSPRF
jgi:hypothetical protein